MANYIKRIGRGCCCVNSSETDSNEPSQGLVLSTTYSVSSAEPTRLYFYNTDETQGVPIIRGVDMFDKVEIDGVEVNVADLDADGGTYNLGVGTHTVNYTLKDGVTSVPMGAFVGCSSLTSINIPSGVTSIGDGAFNTCSGLTSVTFEEGSQLNSIGEFAFEGCISLTSVTIPESVTSINSHAFSNCISLTSITIPDSVTSINSHAFSNCISLTSINIPSGVTGIEDYVFDVCTSLTSITIPSGVISIGEWAFGQCSSLISITIPNSVTSIGGAAFSMCSNLSNITCLPTVPPTLGGNAFNRNASGRKIYVPSDSVNAYKAATNWSDYASDIEPIT